MNIFFSDRSGVKIMSMGGANTDLSVTLSEVKNMRTAAKAFMNAQNLGESYNLLRKYGRGPRAGGSLCLSKPYNLHKLQY